ALDFIYHMGRYKESKLSMPGLILLDISMPVMNGFEVLKVLKSDARTTRIPIIMLTTSSREEDIVKSYEYGACSYITKPADFNGFVKVMEHFEIYWTLVSKVPDEDE
ncbi:MAG: response regulator, partial [Elusimicrobia bacterium]|nr:response regulator [Elusimicrobiota bacterium]